MLLALAAVCALLGLVVGSFLNVVIHRVPRKESVVTPRSRCGTCGTEIRPLDNIPVLSWIRLRGRCRDCGSVIAARYPAVEAGCALLWAAIAYRLGFDPAVPAFCVAFAGMLALSLIDLEHFLLPNRVLYPTLGATALLLGAAFAVERDLGHVRSALIGGALCFTILFVIWFVAPRAMGYGDVRLAALIGMLLGWLGVGAALLSIFLGFAVASVTGIGLLVLRRRGRKDPIPFGPFLVAGALLSFVLSEPILRWYLPA